ncbi:hypothetical protein CHH28_12850 [Bacterioplanes sanyensis]|uniref:Pyridoxamine 5'-phosphate oxidase putative domain-containing protein n=1 Tax=Bacterioplanes sanyensis TaxID=1249553 RepID=A0A222FLN8_9GAMM|nr:hypothetical protein [Bacterioplanes sanyensis]ASP39506.1 hypothetical protein CHH28_12850 [Bacterioplanes sanyensis]
MSIETEKQLRAIIPPHSPLLDKRVLASLDAHCENYLSHSRCALLALANHPQPFYALNAKQWTFTSATSMELNDVTIEALSSKQAASLFFWIPGVDHGLRINGWLEQNRITIEQVYLHCGRAAMRAQWWQPTHPQPIIDDDASWVAHARYGFLFSQDEQGLSQLSPRGEPNGGFLLHQGCLWIPERPGNKYAISLRNVLKNPQLTVALLIPGLYRLRWWHGTASIDDGDVWSACAVDGKTPKLGLRLNIHTSGSAPLPALQSLWKNANANANTDTLTPFSKALSEHMSGKGLMGKLTHGVVNHIIEKDKRQLY